MAPCQKLRERNASPLPMSLLVNLAGVSVPCEGPENLYRDRLLNTAKVGPGLRGPDQALTHYRASPLPV